MKKILVILFLAAVTLSSCLKDKPNTDFSSIGPVLELPYAGLQYFSRDAVLDASDTVILKFGVNMASASPLSTDTKYTIAVDNSLVAAYLKTDASVAYLDMPDGSYTLSKTAGVIKAGARLDSVTVTVYRSKLDPSKSYMLPIKLASTSNGILSGNFNAHYYHFIGNDFAGTYKEKFQRWNATDSTSVGLNSLSYDFSQGNTASFVPQSPSEIQFLTGYAGGIFTYDVTFTKNSDGTYSNFTVSFTAASVSSAASSSVTPAQNPVFLVPGGTPSATLPGPYTYAQAVKLFHFQFIANSGTAPRYIVDTYAK